jgi:hypothetical protein
VKFAGTSATDAARDRALADAEALVAGSGP